MNEQEKSMTPETAETDTVMGVNEENITSACACAKAQENAECRENAHTCAKKSDKKAENKVDEAEESTILNGEVIDNKSAPAPIKNDEKSSYKNK